MVQSACVRLIGNFGRMQKNQYPMVLYYNGRDHYAPTRSVSLEDFYRWKMEKELGPVLSGALFIIEEIDRTKLPPNVLQEVNEVQAQIVKSLPIISPQANSSHLRKAANPDVRRRGPIFSQEGGSQVSSSVTGSDLPPAPTGTGTTGSSSTQPPTNKPARGKRPSKGGYPCHLCSTKRDRKSDLDGHLWVVHRIGEPIQCNIAPCQQRDFATKGSLKSHIQTQHRKKFEHKCPDCEFGSQSRNYYIEHRIKKHGIRMMSKKDKTPVIYHCSKCGKVFPGPASLQRRKQRGLCKTTKKITCPDCPRKFKTKKGRDIHVNQFHNPSARTWVCPRENCAKQLNSRVAYHNHQAWHNGMTSRVRRQRAKERRRQQAHLRMYAKTLSKKKAKSPRKGDPDFSQASSKSAPAKVILLPPPRRSPRGHKGSKK